MKRPVSPYPAALPTLPDIVLKPGQRLYLHADAGDRLQVLAGQLRLVAPPCWLGERLVELEWALSAEAYRELEPGDWRVIALHDSRLRLLPAEVVPTGLLARLVSACRTHGRALRRMSLGLGAAGGR
jgi:hypothetical protein